MDDGVGSFWWRDLVGLIAGYKEVARCLPGGGSTISFWKDAWDSDPFMTRFSRIFSFAINKEITLLEFHSGEDRYDLFALPLSTLTFDELQHIIAILHSAALDQTDQDLWICRWGSGAFSTKLFYQHHFPALHRRLKSTWIWKNNCLPKIKGFAWLLYRDRVNTRDMMDRRNCNRDGVLSCALCDSGSRETRDHLFFTCFSAECWLRIGVNWSPLPSEPSLPNRLHLVKARVPVRIHQEVFLSMA